MIYKLHYWFKGYSGFSRPGKKAGLQRIKCYVLSNGPTVQSGGVREGGSAIYNLSSKDAEFDLYCLLYSLAKELCQICILRVFSITKNIYLFDF